MTNFKRMKVRILLFCGFLLVAGLLVHAQNEAVTTMDKAISLFEEHWENKDTVDWDTIRETYLAKANELQSAEETYP